MNSKRSFTSISVPFIVENLKRFWIGSAFALVGYLCACCIPLFMEKNISPEMISSILTMTYAPVVLMTCIVPIVAALLIYSYMHNQSSVAVVHSLPYTRKQIFHSGYISGLILCLAPIIITGILLTLASIFTEPVIQLNFDPQIGFVSQDVFTPGRVLEWMGIICLLNITVFTLSTFAAVLTGSTLIQASISIVLLFIVPMLVELMNLIGSRMLYGYCTPDWISTITVYTSVPLAMISEGSVTAVLCQLCAAFVIYVISYYLYSKRHMEKVRDTLIFNIVKPIVKYIVTFIGMCCFAFFLESFYSSAGNKTFYLEAFIGALISYIAADMIIQKRIKIKGFVKGFGLYLIAAVIFFAMFACDILGYETNIPDSADVKGIRIEGISDTYYEFGYDEGVDTEIIGYINDPAVIQNVSDLHRDIIGEKDRFFHHSKNYYGADGAGNVDTIWMNISYKLDNGKTVQREYSSIPAEWLRNNVNLISTVESDAYKKIQYPILNWDLEKNEISKIVGVTGYEADICGKQNVYITDEEKISQLCNAYVEDIKSLDFNSMNTLYTQNDLMVCSLEFMVKNNDRISEELNKKYYEYYGCYYDEEYHYYTFDINKNYAKTIALLKEWGLYDDLAVTPEDISYAKVTKVEMDEDGNEKRSEPIKITDKVILENIMTTSQTGWSGNCRYEIAMYPNRNDNEENYFNLYYNEKDAPTFITEAF